MKIFSFHILIMTNIAYLLHDNKNFIRIFSIYYFTSIDEYVERIYSIIDKINITSHVYFLNIMQYIH